MLKFLIIALLLVLAITTDLFAIPARDKQSVIEELDSYGMSAVDQYAKKKPSSADDYYKQGVSYLSRNMAQQAVLSFQKALELNPLHTDSLIGMAVGTSWLGDTESAKKYSSKAVVAEPNSAKVRNADGVLQATTATTWQHLEGAIARFKEAVALDPKFVPSHMNLARLYILLRKPAEAVKEYRLVIDIEPKYLMARAGIVTAYLYAGSTDKAMEEAKKIAELFPQNSVAHNILGEVYLRNGKLDEALAEFQQAVKLELSFATGYKNIGDVYLVRKMLDKAIEQYNRALSLRSNYGEAYARLGDAYLTKGMLQRAAEEYKNAIRYLPASALSVSVYNNLAYIYAGNEQSLDEALYYAERAEQLAPKHPEVADTLGWIYYKKGRYDEAVAKLKSASDVSPNNPTIRYHLASAYSKQGAKDKAIAELRFALSLGDKFEGAEDAKRLLAELQK